MPEIMEKVKVWCTQLGVSMEDLFDPSHITPKIHVSRHLARFLQALGPMHNFDTFEFENLLSNVRRALLATREPSIQGLEVLKRFVMIPVINEYFGTRSALEDVLGIVPEVQVLGKAAIRENVPIETVDIYKAVFLLDSSIVNCEIEFYGSAVRKQNSISYNAVDKNQSFSNLKGTLYNKRKHGNRVDYHVCYDLHTDSPYCADILCFVLISGQVYIIVEQYETKVHHMSEELIGFHDKFFFTTPSKPGSMNIVPLSFIDHKCDLYKNKEKKTWFY